MKYSFIFGGGLGDAMMTYLTHPFWKRLEAFKQQRDPNVEVYVWAQVHNNGFEDLFVTHPYVKRHIQICNIPQHHGYNDFDHSLMPGGFINACMAPIQDLPEAEPCVNLLDNEADMLDSIFRWNKPIWIIQPFAGLDERNAFDQNSLRKFQKECDLPGTKIFIGKNHWRTYKNVRERIPQLQPYFLSNDFIDLTDQIGLRFTYHLLKRCTGFIGCHSSMVLLAWHFNKPTTCVLPWPNQEGHWGRLEEKYKQGVGRDNTLITKFNAGANCPNDFDYNSLNINEICEHMRRFI